MTRRVRALLLAGCAVIAMLQLPAALRSVSESWRGPYAQPALADSGDGAIDTAEPAGGALAAVATSSETVARAGM